MSCRPLARFRPICRAAGNLLSDGINSYGYDDENRIVNMAMSSGGTTTYFYDAEGKRIRRAIGSAVNEYIYDAEGRQIGDIPL
jgi:YD repeat-containing protein